MYVHAAISGMGDKKVYILARLLLSCLLVNLKDEQLFFESATFRLQRIFQRFTALMHLEEWSLQSTHTTPKWHLLPKTSSTFALLFFEAEHSFINAMKRFSSPVSACRVPSFLPQRSPSFINATATALITSIYSTCSSLALSYSVRHEICNIWPKILGIYCVRGSSGTAVS